MDAMRFHPFLHFQWLNAIENGGASLRHTNSELIRVSLITRRAPGSAAQSLQHIGMCSPIDLESFRLAIIHRASGVPTVINTCSAIFKLVVTVSFMRSSSVLRFSNKKGR
jgi:hypothetical protein